MEAIALQAPIAPPQRPEDRRRIETMRAADEFGREFHGTASVPRVDVDHDLLRTQPASWQCAGFGRIVRPGVRFARRCRCGWLVAHDAAQQLSA